jgi:putative DNA primase/helicase
MSAALLDFPAPDIAVTFFVDHAAKSKSERRLSLPALAKMIDAASAVTKDDLPWLKLARFGDARSAQNSLRHDGNMLAVSGVEADYDGERVGFDAAVETLRRAEVAAIIYTSPSHTPERPRWRVLCPFSAELSPARREHEMDRLNGLFGGIFAGESWTLSQSYYYGSVAGNPTHRVEVVPGRPIDLCEELDATARGKANGLDRRATKPPPVTGDAIPLEELSEWARELLAEGKSEGRKVKQRGPQCWTLLRYLHTRGYTFDQCVDLARRYPDGVFGKYEGRIAEEAARMWAKFDAPAQSDLPVVTIDPGKHEENARAGMNAISRAPFYQRGGRLVHVVPIHGKAWDGEGVVLPAIAEVSKALLGGKMSDAAYWLRRDEKGIPIRMSPPPTVVEMAIDLPDAWPFPVLRGVIGTPTLRHDGSVLTEPGYDPATGFVLHNPPRMPPLPERPTREQALEALATLDGLLVEFPFADDASRSVALSGFMTTVMRGAIDVAPLHAFSAPAAGTGKSYLVDLFSMLAYGDRAAVIAQSSKEDETEKRLIGAALSGQSVIALDNCSAALAGDFLCQVTERPVMKLRALGSSAVINVDNTFTTFANGNNLEVVADQVRRTVMCWLDANQENPEEREFTKKPIVEIRKDRGKYVAAVLTIARAYRCAGEPACKGYPSYDSWSRLVRSPLMWLGRSDPVASVTEIRAEDPERAKREAVFAEWPQGGRPHTTGELIRLAEDYNPDLRDALLAVAMGRDGNINPERLGKWLRKQARVVVRECKLDPGKNERGKSAWTLVRTGELRLG